MEKLRPVYRELQLGDVVNVLEAWGPALGIIIDGGTATWADFVVAVQGQEDLYHAAWYELEYVRPSYLAWSTLHDDEDMAAIHEHIAALPAQN